MENFQINQNNQISQPVLLDEPRRMNKKVFYVVLVLLVTTAIVVLALWKSKAALPPANLVEDLNSESRFVLTEKEKATISEDIEKPSTRELTDEEKEYIIRSLQQ